MSKFDQYNKLTIARLKILADKENIQLPHHLKKKKNIINYIISHKDDYFTFMNDLNDEEDDIFPEIENISSHKNLLKDEFIPSRTKINNMSENDIYNFMKGKNIDIPHGIGTLQDLRSWTSGVLQEIADGYQWNDYQHTYKYSYDLFIPVRVRKRIKIGDLVNAMQLNKIIKKKHIVKHDIIELSNENSEYEWLNELKYVGDDVCINWRQHLVIFGWTVIEKSINKRRAEKYALNFWYWSEGLEFKNKYIDKDDYKTWELFAKNGKIKGKIYHQDFLWNARKEMKKYFDEIFMTDDLACSFEGVDLSIPPEEEDKGVVKLKLKHDQFRIDDRFINIKGLLVLNDCGKRDGGICFVQPNDKNVKEFFSEYMKNHPSYGISSHSTVNQKDHSLRGLQFKKICANKGDLVILDTRLMYGIVETQDNFRLGFWMSQQPTINMENITKKNRLKAFENEKGTGVWTFGPWYEEIEPILVNNKRDKIPKYNDIKDLI